MDVDACTGRILMAFWNFWHDAEVKDWDSIENSFFASIKGELECLIEAHQLADYCNRLGWPESPDHRTQTQEPSSERAQISSKPRHA